MMDISAIIRAIAAENGIEEEVIRKKIEERTQGNGRARKDQTGNLQKWGDLKIKVGMENQEQKSGK